jgi:hypothetical protein
MGIGKVNELQPPNHMAENLSYEDDIIRRKYHYPNIVAKKFNRPYVTKWGNGGSNDDILNILEEGICTQMTEEGIELIVIQFTHVFRDDTFKSMFTEKKEYSSFLKFYVQSILERIEVICKNITFDKNGNSKNAPYLVMAWHEDISSTIANLSEWRDKLIDFNYNGNIYNCIDLLMKNDNLTISDKFKGVDDNHPSRECHQIIADNVIDKIKKSNIRFTQVHSWNDN